MNGLWLAIGFLTVLPVRTPPPQPGGPAADLGLTLGRAGAWFSVVGLGLGALLAAAHFLLAHLFPASLTAALVVALWAALTVVVVTGLNVAGVRHGKRAQNVLTAAEVLGLLLIVGAGLALAPGAAPAATAKQASPAFGLVMVFVLLTYGGWNEAAYISAELKDPRRNMVRALVWSILIVTGLYLLVNWAYLQGLGLAGMAASKTVAADLVERSAGAGGGRLVSLLIVVSAFTSVNAAVFTGARTAYAFGRDFRAFSLLGRWHGRADGPVNALLVQGGVALALVLLGALTRKGFETMVEYTAPVFWLFFFLVGVSVFVLRRREPDAPRPFRVPLYPVTPILFCATCAYLLYSSLAYTGAGALVGLGVLATGAIVLALIHPSGRQGGS